MKKLPKSRFKHGDLVLITDEENKDSKWYMKKRILTIAFYIDIKKHPTFNGDRSGIFLLRGQLNGNNPLNLKSHGKTEGFADAYYNSHAYKIGHVSSLKVRKLY